MDTCSLHMHTTASDGVYSPSKLVSLCEGKLRALAITDHDTTAGVAEAMAAAKRIEVIPGIECDCSYGGTGIEILGYFIDIDDSDILHFSEDQRSGREHYTWRLIDKYNELFPKQAISEKDVQKLSFSMFGKPLVAKLMVSKGIVSTHQEAFDKYLGKSGQIKTKSEGKKTAEEVIKMILSSGGIPSIAHPIIYEWKRAADSPTAEELIIDLKKKGMLGVEAYHPEHTPENAARFRKIAEDNNLLFTGGSDFHGLGEKPWDKNVDYYTVPYLLLENLKRKKFEMQK